MSQAITAIGRYRLLAGTTIDNEEVASKAYVNSIVVTGGGGGSSGSVLQVRVMSPSTLWSFTVDQTAGTIIQSTSNGRLTLDDIELTSSGDRFLLKDNADMNGIYELINSGGATVKWSAKRLEDVSVGQLIFVAGGTTGSGSLWVRSTGNVYQGTVAMQVYATRLCRRKMRYTTLPLDGYLLIDAYIIHELDCPGTYLLPTTNTIDGQEICLINVNQDVANITGRFRAGSGIACTNLRLGSGQSCTLFYNERLDAWLLPHTGALLS